MHYSYLIPVTCYLSVHKIISELKKYNFVGQDSCVNSYTTDSCEIIIKDIYDNKDKHDRLFARLDLLMISDLIYTEYNMSKGALIVYFDNLKVRDVKITDKEFTLLEYFSKEKKYIINLTQDNNKKASFYFATRQIKHLLTVAGSILEIFTYHKIKETGKFDDVAGSFEISWNNGEVKNEIDCIATRGFTTLLIECKARKNLNVEFYDKLSNISNQFGVNPKVVLIADTNEERTDNKISQNDIHRERGNIKDIITIWKYEEITNIGNVLLSVIKGNYKNKISYK